MNTLLRNAEVIQNCYVVRDLEQACERLHKMYGIGPFLGGAEAALEEHRYRGRAEEPIRIRGVFVQSGDLNIELVQLVSKAPSAFHDMFPNMEEGFHHVAIFCEDYEKQRDAFVAEGWPVASEFSTIGKTFCYIDARDPLGHMIELYPPSDIVRRMYQVTRDAARDWDGGDLIVPWPANIFLQPAA